jgi:hypothetical protein
MHSRLCSPFIHSLKCVSFSAIVFHLVHGTTSLVADEADEVADENCTESDRLSWGVTRHSQHNRVNPLQTWPATFLQWFRVYTQKAPHITAASAPELPHIKDKSMHLFAQLLYSLYVLIKQQAGSLAESWLGSNQGGTNLPCAMEVFGMQTSCMPR